MNNNRKAFLDMIAWAEGTSTIRGSDNGYNVLVGGTLFPCYADHPRRPVWLPAYKVWSTAAGRYQLLGRYFDHYKKLLNLPDFSPVCQDAIALQQIREQKALPDVDAGEVLIAIKKCRNLWASLPGAGYGQRERSLPQLLAVYTKAGGVIANESVA